MNLAASQRPTPKRRETMIGWDDKIDNKKDAAVGVEKEKVGEATNDKEMERQGRNEQTRAR
jgi:uncharacterized protein YjbJ (UPF0337 family)